MKDRTELAFDLSELSEHMKSVAQDMGQRGIYGPDPDANMTAHAMELGCAAAMCAEWAQALVTGDGK